MGKLFRKTIIKTDLNRCWEFFSSPENLARITPSSLSFKIDQFDGNKMYAGQEIGYTVKPFFGIPLKWKTRIESVTDKKEFVDRQIKGPYKIWHHRHIFREVPDGTEITDMVHYRLPAGWVGKFIEILIVKQKVENIFNYREKAIRLYFN